MAVSAGRLRAASAVIDDFEFYVSDFEMFM
jgi:hypothetical protein